MEIVKWLLEIAILFLLTGLTIRGAIQVRSGYRKLGGRVQDARDLEIVRGVINGNMRAAVWVVFWMCVYVLTVMAFNNFVMLPVLAPLMLPLGLYGRKQEKNFREMPVTAADPRVDRLFQHWTRQWRGAYNRLPRAEQELADLLATPAPVLEDSWPPAPQSSER